jgi:hypothetical protein
MRNAGALPGAMSGVSVAVCLIGIAVFALRTAPAADAEVRSSSGAQPVLIGKGRDSRLSWIALLEGAQDRGSPQRPCVTLRVAYPTSSGGSGKKSYEEGEGTECGEVTEDQAAIQSFGVGSGRREETVLVLVYPVLATKAILYLRDKPVRAVSLKRLSSARAAEMSIEPVSVWAGSVSGSFCLKRVKFLTREGDVLNDSGRIPCRVQR